LPTPKNIAATKRLTPAAAPTAIPAMASLVRPVWLLLSQPEVVVVRWAAEAAVAVVVTKVRWYTWGRECGCV